MNIVFRVDAALHIGSGHVMRCLTLADELARHDINCIFICREFDGNLFSTIKSKGFSVYPLPKIEQPVSVQQNQLVPHEHWLATDYANDAEQTIVILKKLAIRIDWLVIDHYAIDYHWQDLMRPFVNKIMAIDDLADRKHNCDLLLDQSYGRKESDYQELNCSPCQYLLGTKFALLRTEFSDYREQSLKYYDNNLLADPIKRIFISMGGVDKENCTGFILDCFNQIALSEKDELHIVMGKNAMWLSDIQQRTKLLQCKVQIYHDVHNIAEIMANCNLAIGAGGTTSWERSALAIPAIVISMADNQDYIVKELAECGAHWYVGKFPLISKDVLISFIQHALNDKLSLKNLSRIARNICDAKGAKRVTRILLQPKIYFDNVTMQDIDLLYQWRNHPKIRSQSFNSEEINYQDHANWIAEKIKDTSVKLLLAMTTDKTPIGCVRLDLNRNKAELSIYLDPERFSNGFGKLILSEILVWIKQHCSEILEIHAHIKTTNKISQAIFESAGYVKTVSSYLFTL